VPYPVSDPGNYYPVFHKIPPTLVHIFIHDVKQLNSTVALMYFRLHIQKLHRSITRRALVSETTNIISWDAPSPQAVVFVTYLVQMEFETGSG